MFFYAHKVASGACKPGNIAGRLTTTSRFKLGIKGNTLMEARFSEVDGSSA